MSLTKENPAFDRMMEEAREEDQNSYEIYREWAYMKAKEAREQNSKPAEPSAQQQK